jgi:hypothetical protein
MPSIRCLCFRGVSHCTAFDLEIYHVEVKAHHQDNFDAKDRCVTVTASRLSGKRLYIQPSDGWELWPYLILSFQEGIVDGRVRPI